MNYNASKNYHVYIGKEIFDYSRKEFIQHLIDIGQIKKYETMSKKFKKETKENELPVIQKTKSGYVYAVIK
jgi:hypothetical protein